MKKVITTIEKEISRLKMEVEKSKAVIVGSLDDIYSYTEAVKEFGPKLEELNKLDKVIEFVNNIQTSPVEEEKPKSKRGRPKKNS